jgi:CIC family chloride channel protein
MAMEKAAISPPVEAPTRTRPGRVFHDTMSSYLRGLSPGSRRFWLLVPLSGALTAIAAVGAVHLMRLVEHLAWDGAGSLLESTMRASWRRRLLVPTAAGALVVLLSVTLRTLPQGYGTSRVIEAIWVRRGRVPLLRTLLRGVLTMIVVGMGASLGREGALIPVGAAIGSWLGRRFRLDPDQLKVLVACGASAGVAAAYNTPIGGALFALEVFLGGLALELYGPLIFAAVSSTVISRALLSDHPTYVIPHYRLNHPAELAIYLVLGVAVGALSAGFVRTVETTARLAAAAPAWLRTLLPVLGLGLVGAVGIVLPHVYGNGYETVDMALAGVLALRMLLVLPPLKLVLSSVCAASGAPGGLFTPSLFVGGLFGAAFGEMAHRLFPALVPSTGGYTIVAMGAMLAGSTHATLAAALMLVEMTGSYDVILPLLAACVLSTAVSRRITAESIYTAPLKRRGVELPRITRPAWMQREGFSRLLRRTAPSVRPSARLDEIALALVDLEDGEPLYVVDERDRLVGAIPVEAVRDSLAELPDLDLVVAADLMEPATAVSIDASLWEVTRRALAADSGRLPVQSPREGGRLVGTVSISDVLAAARRSA